MFLPTLWKTNKSEPIFHKVSNSPCTDLLMALPLKQLIDVDSNCIIKKVKILLYNKFYTSLSLSLSLIYKMTQLIETKALVFCILASFYM